MRFSKAGEVALARLSGLILLRKLVSVINRLLYFAIHDKKLYAELLI